MELGNQVIQTQKLSLTQTMCQALHILQLPICDLYQYVYEVALSNPFLQVDSLSDQFSEFERSQRMQTSSGVETSKNLPVSTSGNYERGSYEVTKGTSFVDYLERQIGELRDLPLNMKRCCIYLIGCLSSSGYLEFPLEELSAESGYSLFDLEQALYVVQMLEPTGVGARSLSECLLLQLLQSGYFSETNIHAITWGLSLIAEGDVKSLAKLLHVPLEEARQTMDVVRLLNPIPSRGFDTGETISYALPDALLTVEDYGIKIDMSCSFLAQIQLNPDYCQMVGNDQYREIQPYLKKNQEEARSIIWGLKNRQDTLFRIISLVAREQQHYFLSGCALRPFTMKQVAEKLDLSVSTISRAVKDKTIQFNGKIFPLKKFFQTANISINGNCMTSDAVRQLIQKIIQQESPGQPLSDQAICEILERSKIYISRRTVAKYRTCLGIAAHDKRRINSLERAKN